jgi:cytidylate kinase
MAVITISRGTFSGGKQLAECVAERLGYQCISQEVLQEAAQEYGVSIDRLSRALATKPGILENVNRERARYLECITAELLRFAKDGNLVYHGLAGHLLLKGVAGVMRVRVIADMEFRIRNAMECNRFDRDQAIQFIKKVDASRVKWTKLLYNVDWFDLQLYDLVINLHRLSMPAACAIICMSAESQQFKDTPESIKARHDLWIAADVKARIMTEEGIKNEKVDITADGSVVNLNGEVSSSLDAEKIIALARQAPGVTQVVSKLSH